ncbi:MAG: hypothetical protein NTW14_08330 [bacterium]|nr:hypothetical protein [bacterium]
MRNRKRVTIPFFCIVITAIITLMAISVLAGEKQKVTIMGTLRVSYSRPAGPPFIMTTDLKFYFQEETSYVLPGTDIIGEITLVNNTLDTLKLTNGGANLVQYLALQCDQDSLITLDNSLRYWDDDTLLDYGLPPASTGSGILSPGEKLNIRCVYPWSEIAKRDDRLFHLKWKFNNLLEKEKNSEVIGVVYESKPYNFENLPIVSKSDSIFLLDVQSQNKNINEDFLGALELCNQMIQLDSMNLSAYRTAADVLWKTNRFDEAIEFAQRGIIMLQRWSSKKDCKDYVVWGDDFYIGVMTDFITKCQKREKWKWAK